MSVLPVTGIVQSQYEQENKNITNTCRLFNITRTTFYEWIMRFKKLGCLELEDKERYNPRMPNKIKSEYEKIIYNYVRDHPTHDPEESPMS